MDASNRADDMDLELNFPTDLGGKKGFVYMGVGCLVMFFEIQNLCVSIYRVVPS